MWLSAAAESELTMTATENNNTTLPDGYQLAEMTAADREEILRLHRWAFPTELTQEELLSTPDTLDYSRTPGIRFTAAGQLAAMQLDTGQLAAMHTSIAWEQLPVPGGSVKAAGLTWVETHPQHRRRGLLKAMMGLHFSHCQQRGEALSMLTASEAVIYGRFGYGLAAKSLAMTLSRGTALRPVTGSDAIDISFLDIDRDSHTDLVEGLHRAVGSPSIQGGLARPGWATRDTPGYRQRMLFEQPRLRRGFEEERLMLACRDGEPVGFALFRRSDIWSTWDSGFGGIEVVVNEYAAVDGAAAYALWSRLLDLDLTDRVRILTLPIDDPLLGLLVDVSAANPKLEDLLWVRLINAPQALAARQYAADIDIVLEVSDSLLPANQGRWHLKAAAFSSDVEVDATDAAPDLCLDIRELGAAYLGGSSLAALAASGLVSARTPELLLQASAAFNWPIAPGCSWHF
jgi:predicted acetyltransferase